MPSLERTSGGTSRHRPFDARLGPARLQAPRPGSLTTSRLSLNHAEAVEGPQHHAEVVRQPARHLPGRPGRRVGADELNRGAGQWMRRPLAAQQLVSRRIGCVLESAFIPGRSGMVATLLSRIEREEFLWSRDPLHRKAADRHEAVALLGCSRSTEGCREKDILLH
jgi:hypothetical protein